MLEIYLIRHGECRGNRENLFRGRHDFPLNKNGIVQAECLRERLTGISFDRIYTSPLKRSSQTAEIISRGEIEIALLEEFTNISLGEWEGMPKEFIAKKYPRLWQLWKTQPEKLNFPGMETLASVRKRSFAALKKIISKHPQGRVAVVTHRAVIKPLIAAILNIPEPYFWKIHIDTAAYAIVEYHLERGFTLMLLNETDHLQDFVREDVA
ncbi:MAG: histidine phosphatase family protein [Calditrichia bacterium]